MSVELRWRSRTGSGWQLEYRKWESHSGEDGIGWYGWGAWKAVPSVVDDDAESVRSDENAENPNDIREG